MRLCVYVLLKRGAAMLSSLNTVHKAATPLIIKQLRKDVGASIQFAESFPVKIARTPCSLVTRRMSRWFFYATRWRDGQCDYMISAWKLVTNLMKGSLVESVAILAQASSFSNVRTILLRHELFWFCLVQVSTAQFRCLPLVLMAPVDDASDS